MNPILQKYMEEKSALVDQELKKLVATDPRDPIPFLGKQPATLRKAMSYSLMAGGKRLRPVLVMAAAEACGISGAHELEDAMGLEQF